ncbi:hypothetical protein [Mesorhizobium sp.]|uniref:hypothetical protein n=1 Tax=Mesorhizobium sp. TaxID=1871066 RepID=UPI00257C3F22|nr:hypothetical protein [Mesorhizobium sp.]
MRKWSAVVRQGQLLSGFEIRLLTLFRPLALPLTCLPASSPRIVTGRGAPIEGFANHQRCRMFTEVAAASSPRPYTGRSARQGDEGRHQDRQLVVSAKIGNCLPSEAIAVRDLNALHQAAG